MEKALWYLIAGTRGGANRARIIRLLDAQPRNANQLADELPAVTVGPASVLVEREFVLPGSVREYHDECGWNRRPE